MKTLKIKLSIISLVICFISCNNNPKKLDDELLEKDPNKQKTEIESLIITKDEEWVNKVKEIQELDEGETFEYNSYYQKSSNGKTQKTNNDYLIDVSEFEKTNNDFEYSEKWRIEAYKATKKYVTKKITTEDPNCRVISQGKYHPNNVRYLGGKGFMVQLYTTFDCGLDYNNPSIFWVEVYYLGNNTWDGKLIKQRFVD